MASEMHISELADRLEAAAKREKAQPGNAAAMREAASDLVDYYLTRCHSCMSIAPDLHQLIEKTRSALSAPPRNCDVGTAEEQVERWRRYCSSHRSGASCDGCPLETDDSADCYSTWAQMPYAEEGVEG